MRIYINIICFRHHIVEIQMLALSTNNQSIKQCNICSVGHGDAGLFLNKTDYPTLTRLAYCQCRIRRVLYSVFVEFGWKNIAIIYDLNNYHTDVLATTLRNGLQTHNIFPYTRSYYGNQNTSFAHILWEVRKVSRSKFKTLIILY